MEPQLPPQGWGWFLCFPSGARSSPRCPHMWVLSILPFLLSPHLCTPRLTPRVSPSSFCHSTLPSRSGQDTPVCSGPETPQPSGHPVAPHGW